MFICLPEYNYWSSIVQVIFRIIESEPDFLDNIGTNNSPKMGLHSLGKNISVLPNSLPL